MSRKELPASYQTMKTKGSPVSSSGRCWKPAVGLRAAGCFGGSKSEVHGVKGCRGATPTTDSLAREP